MARLSHLVTPEEAIDILASALMSLPGGIDALEAALAAHETSPKAGGG